MEEVLVANIQKYAIHDGKGIRTTVFFKGCPLACRWCHNPETQGYGRELIFYEERCTGCGECVEECGNGAVTAADGKVYTDRELCRGCGECVDGCMRNARQLCGRGYSVGELAEELLKDRAFYETSGGGVTLSGGEPLVQDMDYLERLMGTLCGRGISVNVDTCGAVAFERLERVMPYTDRFLFDLKLLDEDKHREYTGRDNGLILENLKLLSGKGARIWIRIPVIGGVNDEAEELERMAGFLSENVRAEQINLIPYHNTGSGKYVHLGREYKGGMFYAPPKERMQELQRLMESKNIAPVFIGG